MPKLAGVGRRVRLSRGPLRARSHTGTGSDSPDFVPLLYGAWKRANVKAAVADSGFDGERNHRAARLDMGVRSVIPPNIGRPSDKPPVGRFRRLMRQRFDRKADRHRRTGSGRRARRSTA